MSHFNKFAYNQLTSQFVTTEIGYEAVLNVIMYSYSKEDGFRKLSETKISNVVDVTYIEISRDGSKIAILLPEPTNALKILDYNKESGVLKEILSIPMELTDFKEMRFNPLNKNYIFVMAKSQCQLIEIIDSFADDYSLDQDQMQIREHLEEFKATEEEKLIKRFETFTIYAEQNRQFACFSWDRYGKVYLSEMYNGDSGDLVGEVKFIDPINALKLQREKPEALANESLQDTVNKISSAVTAMVLTQRYLVCAYANGRIALVNMFLPDKDIKENKNTLGASYIKNEVDKELEVTKLSSSSDYIISMKYDLEYKKIMAKTNMNNIYVLFLKGEILGKNIDDNREDNQEQIHDVDNYVETEFHKGKILGIKELGKTTELVSVSTEDSRVIFWDIGKGVSIASHQLEYKPTVYEVNNEGTLLFIASQEGVFRIYDITRRTALRLLYQNKFEYKSSKSIDSILVHPLMKYIIFYQKGGRYLYFISGELSKKFVFLGFLKVPTKILDVCIHNVQGEDFTTDPITLASVLVLVKGMVLFYSISQFFTDNKQCWELHENKVEDVFAKFEFKVSPKARKVDGDLNYLVKNKTTKPINAVWLTGTDKMFRIFPLPTDKLEVVKDSKKPIENPEEFPAHDLLVTEANIYADEYMISSGKDGYIRIYNKKNLYAKYRINSFVDGGITSFQYNHKRHLIYCSGCDGSISVLGVGEGTILPASDTTVDLSTQIIENLEGIEFLDDSLCPNFVHFVNDEHQKLVKKAKNQNQSELKARFDEIKIDQAKLFTENSKLEQHEQLKESDMIIDLPKIEEQQIKNQEIADDLTKKRFKELCEMELQKNVLYDKTYCKMIDKEDDRKVNNNIRLVYNSTGDRELQTYPLPNLTDEFKKKLYFVKQMRLLQKMEDYKRRNDEVPPLIDQNKISCGTESYILNRTASKPVVQEQEVILVEGVGGLSDAEKAAMIAEEKSRNSVVKYRLQRNPYEELNKKGGDDADQLIKGPEEQIYKDDLQMEYRTVVDNKEPPDLEFKPLNEISSYLLLYSPFELYTNIRIRNQIILLLDVIHEYKKTFNVEYFTYIKERNQLLEKFNTNKSAIEAIKEILVDVPIQDYNYAMNPHEDNEWIDKFNEKDITIPHYYSKEEKEKMEQEKKAEEERLKALQGDTMQMRGLLYMIDNKVKKKKENESEQTLVREPWMNKRREEMTDEQAKIFLEFQKKEMELREQKEKIRSQNLTKLNFHKSEIENNQIDLDMKFAKILRKKLHYDSIIAEQEIYILSLMNLLNKRENIKRNKSGIENKLNEAKLEEEKLKNRKDNFENSYTRLRAPEEDKEKERLVPPMGQKGQSNPANDEYLAKIRSDPYFFFEKQKLDNNRHYGNKEYKEYQINPDMKNQNQQQELKRYLDEKYYYEYKKKQFDRHRIYVTNEYINSQNKTKELDEINEKTLKEMEKLKLNFSLMIKMKRGQDEVTDDSFMEKEEDKMEEQAIIEKDNSEEEGEQVNENEIQEQPEQENQMTQEELYKMQQEERKRLENEELKRYSGVPVENSVLVDTSKIDDLNDELQKKYVKKMESEKTNKDHTQMKQYLTLENELLQVSTMDITLKMKYLKLTRVTKKIQEVVTGKEEINQAQIAKLYEDKKRNLEENTNKRIATLEKKLKEINNDIKKKVEENTAFGYKFKSLKEDVEKTEQIIKLDEQIEAGNEYGNEEDQQHKQNVANKSLEIAEVSRLKSIVKNYYEEIEYLRAELDKLRARTFPSFLQKPDNVIYPDEK